MIWVMLGWVTIGLTVTIRAMGDMGDVGMGYYWLDCNHQSYG